MAIGRHRARLSSTQKVAVLLSAVLLAIGLPITVLALTTSTASAAVPTGDDYPYRSTPCAHAPYSVSGGARYCRNYDWGPVREGAAATTYSREYGYGFRNCTDFVAWRLDKVNGVKVARTLGDARTWATNGRAVVNRTPAPGSVAWYGSANHVAWVESVSGGTVWLQDYNHGANGTFMRYAVAANSVPGFIHIKDLGGATPPPPPPPGPVFPVMNTSETPPDGVWFRDNPNVSGPRLTGYGVYAGDRVQLRCYGWGEAIGAYGNRLWYSSVNLTRPNAPGRANVGWLNAHYVNDGQNANAVVPGVGPC